MQNFIRDRIRDRLAATGLNPFEAARQAGHERTFLNDLLIGKKSSIRQSAIPQVAAVLDCDPEYLIGAQDTPRRKAPEAPKIAALAASGTVPLVAIAELGAWRSPAASGPISAMPLQPDPRYPADRQAAYLLRGSHAVSVGVTDGSVIVGVAGEAARDGDVVVARRSRIGEDGPEQEITIRRVAGGDLVADLPEGREARTRTDGAEILARVISAHKIF